MCQIMGFWDMSQDPMMKTSLKPVFSRHSCKSFSVIQSGISLQGRRRLESPAWRETKTHFLRLTHVWYVTKLSFIGKLCTINTHLLFYFILPETLLLSKHLLFITT